jgi:hypothetical protein
MNCEWYFNPEYCERSAFDDYQRLVLHKDVSTHIPWLITHICDDLFGLVDCRKQLILFFYAAMTCLVVVNW